MTEFVQVILSGTSEAEAHKITDLLLGQKLIACADFHPVRANYWWKGEIVKEDRYRIMAYSMTSKKEEIITAVRSIHTDTTPGIVFLPMDANQDFLDWIRSVINGN